MSSLCSKTVKILHSGLFFIHAAVMWPMEPLWKTMYICIYIYIYIDIPPQHFNKPSDIPKLITYKRPLWLPFCLLC